MSDEPFKVFYSPFAGHPHVELDELPEPLTVHQFEDAPTVTVRIEHSEDDGPTWTDLEIGSPDHGVSG